MSIEKNKEEIKGRLIKDAAPTKAELNDEELEQVAGGVLPGTYSCTNSNCDLFNVPLVGYGGNCYHCGSSLIKVGDRHGNLY